MHLRACLLAMWLCTAAGCHATESAPVRIFAAASTREALEEATASFRSETGINIEANLGASSDLARQIESGAHADLFLAADEHWADHVANKGFVEERHALLANRLVVIVAAESKIALQDLSELPGLGIKRLALGAPAVPAGRYAREALRNAGCWDDLQNCVLDGGDVRAALTYVARGEAEAGIVYRTDALADAKVRIACEVKASLHAPIVYPLLLIRRDVMSMDARRFYDYLRSAKAAEAFRRAGFGILGGVQE